MAWLEGWSNRLEYTMDGERIDGDLTNFPVLITVNSGTGRNGFNATGVFNELEDTSFSTDNFS